MTIPIDQQLGELYRHCSHHTFFDESSVLVLTEDGQVLTQFGQSLPNDRLQQSGVLMAGAWQASVTLFEGDYEEQMLALGDSNSGFFIAPFSHGHSLLLGIIFKHHVSPGLLKMKTKMLRNFLSENLVSNKADVNGGREDFLFKNITDEELDRLFSFAGI